MRFLFVLGLAAGLAPAQAGEPPLSFAVTVTFGDSLTANGDGLDLPLKTRALYGLDPMEAVFRKGAGPADRLANYAMGGARTVDLQRQFEAYAAAVGRGSHGLATLISYEIGGNDLGACLPKLILGPPGRFESVDRPVDELIATIKNHVGLALQGHPAARVVAWTVPDITVAPAVCDRFKGRLGSNVRAHVKRVNDALRELRDRPRLLVADLDALWKSIEGDPPRILGRLLEKPPAFGKPGALFADPVHPSAVTNSLIANHIIDGMNRRFGVRIPAYTERELAMMTSIR